MTEQGASPTLLSYMSQSHEPSTHGSRAWVQLGLQGNATGALNALKDYLKIPSETAWCMLALPMSANELDELYPILKTSLTSPPSTELACILIDECIHQDSYQKFKDLNKFIKQRRPIGRPCDIGPDYSDKDTSMYDCYRRNNCSESPFLLYATMITAAMHRGKWNFVLEMQTPLVRMTPSVDWLALVLRGWEQGVDLSENFQNSLGKCLLMESHPRLSPSTCRVDEILWRAFGRQMYPMVRFVFGTQPDPQDHGRLQAEVHTLNLLCCTFANQENFETLCKEQGGTMEEWVNRLLGLLDSKPDPHFRLQLQMLINWSIIHGFVLLQQRLFYLCSSEFQMSDEEKEKIVSDPSVLIQRLADWSRQSERECAIKYLAEVARMAALQCYRPGDEATACKLVKKDPELSVMHFPIDRNPVRPERQDGIHASLLCTAVAHWNIDTIRVILDAGGDTRINQVIQGRTNPLRCALLRCDIAIVRLLLERGASLQGIEEADHGQCSLRILCEVSYDYPEDKETHARVLEIANMFGEPCYEGLLHDIPNPAIIEYAMASPLGKQLILNRDQLGNLPIHSAIERHHGQLATQRAKMLLQYTPTEYIRVPSGRAPRDTVFHMIMFRCNSVLIEAALQRMTREDTLLLGEGDRTPMMCLTLFSTVTHREEEPDIEQIFRSLISIGGTEQLLIPDERGVEPFVALCHSHCCYTEEKVIAVLEFILDMLPDYKPHLRPESLFSRHRPRGEAGIPRKKVCVFLLRRQILSMEEFCSFESPDCSELLAEARLQQCKSAKRP